METNAIPKKAIANNFNFFMISEFCFESGNLKYYTCSSALGFIQWQEIFKIPGLFTNIKRKSR
jgi:hypothetical protein